LYSALTPFGTATSAATATAAVAALAAAARMRLRGDWDAILIATRAIATSSADIWNLQKADKR